MLTLVGSRNAKFGDLLPAPMKILAIGRFIAVLRDRRISMAAFGVFKSHLRCRLRGSWSVVRSMRVSLGEMTVSEVMLSEEFDVLENWTVVERVSCGVTCETRTTGVKRLPSTKGIDALVC